MVRRGGRDDGAAVGVSAERLARNVRTRSRPRPTGGGERLRPPRPRHRALPRPRARTCAVRGRPADMGDGVAELLVSIVMHGVLVTLVLGLQDRGPSEPERAGSTCPRGSNSQVERSPHGSLFEGEWAIGCRHARRVTEAKASTAGRRRRGTPGRHRHHRRDGGRSRRRPVVALAVSLTAGPLPRRAVTSISAQVGA